jgi:membrane-associated phospholipid phosphatase
MHILDMMIGFMVIILSCLGLIIVLAKQARFALVSLLLCAGDEEVDNSGYEEIAQAEDSN